jgi:hypothetical protein
MPALQQLTPEGCLMTLAAWLGLGLVLGWIICRLGFG